MTQRYIEERKKSGESSGNAQKELWDVPAKIEHVYDPIWNLKIWKVSIQLVFWQILRVFFSTPYSPVELADFQIMIAIRTFIIDNGQGGLTEGKKNKLE